MSAAGTPPTPAKKIKITGLAGGVNVEIDDDNTPQSLDAQRPALLAKQQELRRALIAKLAGPPATTELTAADTENVHLLQQVELALLKDDLNILTATPDIRYGAKIDEIKEKRQILAWLEGDLTDAGQIADAKNKLIDKLKTTLGTPGETATDPVTPLPTLTLAADFPDTSVTMQPIDPNDPDDVQGVANAADPAKYNNPNEAIHIERNKHQNPYYEFGMALAQAAQHSLTMTLIHYLLIKPILAPAFSELRGDLYAIGYLVGGLFSFLQTFAEFRNRCRDRSLENPGILTIPLAGWLLATGTINRYQFYSKIADNAIVNIARSVIPQIVQDKVFNFRRSDNIILNGFALIGHSILGVGLSVIAGGMLATNIARRIFGMDEINVFGIHDRDVLNAADAHFGAAFSNIRSLIKSTIDLIIPLGFVYNLWTGGLGAATGYTLLCLPFVTRPHDPENGAGRMQARLYNGLFDKTNNFSLCIESLQRTWTGRSVNEGDAASDSWLEKLGNFFNPSIAQARSYTALSIGQKIRFGLVAILPILLAVGLVVSGAAAAMATGIAAFFAGGAATVTAGVVGVSLTTSIAVAGLALGVLAGLGYLLKSIGDWVAGKVIASRAARRGRVASADSDDEGLGLSGTGPGSRVSSRAGFGLGSSTARAAAGSARVAPDATGGMPGTGMTHGSISPPPPPGMGRRDSSAGISLGSGMDGVAHEPGPVTRSLAAMRAALTGGRRGRPVANGASVRPAATRARLGLPDPSRLFSRLRAGAGTTTMGVAGPADLDKPRSGSIEV